MKDDFPPGWLHPDHDWDNHDWQAIAKEKQRVRKSNFLESYRKNLSPREAVGFLRTSRERELRGLVVGDDLLWWDAYYATHGDARDWLGLDGNRSDKTTGIFDVELHIARGGDEVFGVSQNAEGMQKLIEHPSLKAGWKDGLLVVTE